MVLQYYAISVTLWYGAKTMPWKKHLNIFIMSLREVKRDRNNNQNKPWALQFIKWWYWLINILDSINNMNL